MATLNGTVSRDELIGEKPAFIHFWSVSCHLCKEAMPQVNEFRGRYKDKHNVRSVHMPRSEHDLDIGLVKKTAEEHGIIQPILVNNEHKITCLIPKGSSAISKRAAAA